LALVSLLGLGMTQSARAFNETLQQVGSNVVATGSGAMDLTGLFFAFNGGGSVGIWANLGYILTGASGNGDVYGGFTGPTNFGSGGFFSPNASSGDAVAMSATQGLLLVPSGYVSGNALSDSMTFNNATFASLGLTPGTYVWTWGDGGANQNFTLIIGGSVPDGGSTVSLLGFALAGLGILRRKLRC
jgi:hypothetical protein